MKDLTIKSDFQLQYPLSPRKFWKKMLEKALSIFVLMIVLGFLFFLQQLVFSSLHQHVYSITEIVYRMILFDCIGLAIILLGYACYIKAYINRYFYDVGDDFITIRKGVFAPAEIHVQYQKIQDVYVEQDILDRLMGLYDVHIASATISSGREAHIDGVEFEVAESIKNIILEKIKTPENSQNAQINSPESTTIMSSAPMNSESINFTDQNTVSSQNYPIRARWILTRIPMIFFQMCIYAFAVFYILFSQGRHNIGDVTPLAEHLGITSNDMFFIALLIILGGTTLSVLYWFIWKNLFSFALLPEYIACKKGIIARQEQHLPYSAVQDIEVRQSLIHRILGIADIRIQNAANAQILINKKTRFRFNGVIIYGQNISDAEMIADALRKEVLTKKSLSNTSRI